MKSPLTWKDPLMDKNTLLEYIQQQGYCTREDISGHFKGEDPEVIDIHLSAFVDNKSIKKIDYSFRKKHGVLYFIPYQKEG